MKKAKTKTLVIIFQIFSILFFAFGFLGRLLFNNGYELYFFETTCLYFLYQIALSLFLLTEFIFFIVISIKCKKPLFLIVNGFLLPILLIQFFATAFAITAKATVQQYSYEDFDRDIVISSRSLLLGGCSTIYEQINEFCLKEVAEASGDDGYAPLLEEDKYKIEVEDNTITYTYYVDGYSLEEKYKHTIIVEYKNGNYECVCDTYYDSLINE